ncbi:hypothetical protein BJ508DRAFT_304540 [Ascobolus immersus RN42]|uniref:Uncharacterized protein n=1 Tax=Ascobolus immersus RN42 TaxID=1160509 RepID=A0A3N4IC52_ASCIM|nr:hypothetical protein BJ508DRAFT_304540 [Ascobolus immersus RN42]
MQMRITHVFVSLRLHLVRSSTVPVVTKPFYAAALVLEGYLQGTFEYSDAHQTPHSVHRMERLGLHMTFEKTTHSQSSAKLSFLNSVRKSKASISVPFLELIGPGTYLAGQWSLHVIRRSHFFSACQSQISYFAPYKYDICTCVDYIVQHEELEARLLWVLLHNTSLVITDGEFSVDTDAVLPPVVPPSHVAIQLDGLRGPQSRRARLSNYKLRSWIQAVGSTLH